MSVIHRDIKPQNILVPEGKLENLKIIDFGLCTKSTSKDKNLVGSPYFMSPEAVAGEATLKSDLWSLGVIFYLLVYGKMPFEGNDREEIFKKIEKEKPVFPSTTRVSEEGIQLLEALLTRQQERRISVDIALNSKWFTEFKLKKEKNLEERLLKSIYVTVEMSFFFFEVVRNISKVLKDERIERFYSIFASFDSENKGYWEFSEFKKFIRSVKKDIIKAEIEEIFKRVSRTKKERVLVNEFMSLFIAGEVELEGYELWFAFKCFDNEQNYISLETLEKLNENSMYRTFQVDELKNSFRETYRNKKLNFIQFKEDYNTLAKAVEHDIEL